MLHMLLLARTLNTQLALRVFGKEYLTWKVFRKIWISSELRIKANAHEKETHKRQLQIEKCKNGHEEIHVPLHHAWELVCCPSITVATIPHVYVHTISDKTNKTKRKYIYHVNNLHIQHAAKREREYLMKILWNREGGCGCAFPMNTSIINDSISFLAVIFHFDSFSKCATSRGLLHICERKITVI